MKRVAALLLTLLITATALAYSTGKLVTIGPLTVTNNEQNPWTNLNLKNKPENFQFAIVSDRTGGHRPGIFEAAVGKLNLLQPEFVMSVGDLIEGGTTNVGRVQDEWKEFNGFVGQLEMPFFYVPGNHDITNREMVPLWQQQFGQPYFFFTYYDVLFIGLNSEDIPDFTVNAGERKVKPGILGKEQLDWLRGVLAQHADVRWTVIFVHKPMWEYGEHTNWDDVENLLGDRPRTVFAGHHHKYVMTMVNGRPYYALATTGGASNLAGPADGRFDHIVWVTMTSEGPRVANLMLDGIWTADPVAEARAQQAAAEKLEEVGK